MISLALRTTIVRVLNDIAEVKTVLNRRRTDLARIAIAEVLHLLLLHFLHALAAEVLEVPETPIVFDVVNYRSKILLLIGRAYSLVHDVQLGTRPHTLRLIEILELIELQHIVRTFPNNALRDGLVLSRCHFRTPDMMVRRGLNEAKLLTVLPTVQAV